MSLRKSPEVDWLGAEGGEQQVHQEDGSQPGPGLVEHSSPGLPSAILHQVVTNPSSH